MPQLSAPTLQLPHANHHHFSPELLSWPPVGLLALVLTPFWSVLSTAARVILRKRKPAQVCPKHSKGWLVIQTNRQSP